MGGQPGELPGLDVLPRLRSFDFAWLFARPLLLRSRDRAGALVAIGIVGDLDSRSRRRTSGERVSQSLPGHVDPPTRYSQRRDLAGRRTGRCVSSRSGSSSAPSTSRRRSRTPRLVQVSTSLATLFPITPAGIGTEQAFLLYVLSGVGVGVRAPRFQRRGEAHDHRRRTSSPASPRSALTLRTVRYRSRQSSRFSAAAGEAS